MYLLKSYLYFYIENILIFSYYLDEVREMVYNDKFFKSTVQLRYLSTVFLTY